MKLVTDSGTPALPVKWIDERLENGTRSTANLRHLSPLNQTALTQTHLLHTCVFSRQYSCIVHPEVNRNRRNALSHNVHERGHDLPLFKMCILMGSRSTVLFCVILHTNKPACFFPEKWSEVLPLCLQHSAAHKAYCCESMVIIKGSPDECL